MDKFQDKYRITSHRLYKWDYSKDGIYFITIVIENRECILGEIKYNKMVLSDFGKIVHDEWHKSFKIRNELFHDEFIIMPNHLHAMVVLKNIQDSVLGENNQMENHDSGNIVETHGPDLNVETHGPDLNVETHGPDLNVETHGRASLPWSPQFNRKPKSISSFIAGYKSATTSKIDDYIDLHQLGIPKFNNQNKLWQANYYDHIIRNENEYWKIKQYIKNNPRNWEYNKFNDI